MSFPPASKTSWPSHPVTEGCSKRGRVKQNQHNLNLLLLSDRGVRDQFISQRCNQGLQHQHLYLYNHHHHNYVHHPPDLAVSACISIGNCWAGWNQNKGNGDKLSSHIGHSENTCESCQKKSRIKSSVCLRLFPTVYSMKCVPHFLSSLVLSEALFGHGKSHV